MDSKCYKHIYRGKSITSMKCENDLLKEISTKIFKHFHDGELIEKVEGIHYLRELCNLTDYSKREGFIIRKYRNILRYIIRSYRDFEESFRTEKCSQIINFSRTNNTSGKTVSSCSPMSFQSFKTTQDSEMSHNFTNMSCPQDVTLQNVSRDENQNQTIEFPIELLTNAGFINMESQSISQKNRCENSYETPNDMQMESITVGVDDFVHADLKDLRIQNSSPKMYQNEYFSCEKIMSFECINGKLRNVNLHSKNMDEGNNLTSSDMFGSKNDISQTFLSAKGDQVGNESNFLLNEDVGCKTPKHNLHFDSKQLNSEKPLTSMTNDDMIFKKPFTNSLIEDLPIVIVDDNFRTNPIVRSGTSTDESGDTSSKNMKPYSTQSTIDLPVTLAENYSDKMEIEDMNMDTITQTEEYDADDSDDCIEVNACQSMETIAATIKRYAASSEACMLDLVVKIQDLGFNQEHNVITSSQSDGSSMKTGDTLDQNKRILDEVYEKFKEIVSVDESDEESSPKNDFMLDWRRIK